ncbi:hypothetical protein V6Z77_003505 [Aspergillus fumigatus]
MQQYRAETKSRAQVTVFATCLYPPQSLDPQQRTALLPSQNPARARQQRFENPGKN